MRLFDEGTHGALLYEAYLDSPGELWKELLVPHLLDEFLPWRGGLRRGICRDDPTLRE
jgi:hypothetical protein